VRFFNPSLVSRLGPSLPLAPTREEVDSKVGVAAVHHSLAELKREKVKSSGTGHLEKPRAPNRISFQKTGHQMIQIDARAWVLEERRSLARVETLNRWAKQLKLFATRSAKEMTLNEKTWSQDTFSVETDASLDTLKSRM